MSPQNEGQLPITGYDRLDPKQLRAQLSALSQVDLAAVESYERSHQARAVVLNRVHWLKVSEPLSGYDALDTDSIVVALSGADKATLMAVRDYERHHRDRRDVRVEVDRALPTAPVSAGEDRARKEQAGLVRAGFASREKTAGGLASDRPAPDGREEPKD